MELGKTRRVFSGLRRLQGAELRGEMTFMVVGEFCGTAGERMNP
jgi:hypothetical protein